MATPTLVLTDAHRNVACNCGTQGLQKRSFRGLRGVTFDISVFVQRLVVGRRSDAEAMRFDVTSWQKKINPCHRSILASSKVHTAFGFLVHPFAALINRVVWQKGNVLYLFPCAAVILSYVPSSYCNKQTSSIALWCVSRSLHFRIIRDMLCTKMIIQQASA